MRDDKYENTLATGNLTDIRSLKSQAATTIFDTFAHWKPHS